MLGITYYKCYLVTFVLTVCSCSQGLRKGMEGGWSFSFVVFVSFSQILPVVLQYCF